MKEYSNTAILIFTRTHMEEARVKVFNAQSNMQGNAAIAEQLIQHSIRVAEQTNLPVFPVYSTEQLGNSFGEKLANAVEFVYEKGFEKVIVIGNDCPQITAKQLLSASATLDKKDLVIGPASDGGIYLLGLKKSAYERAAFIKLAWEEKTLQKDFIAYAALFNFQIERLSILHDIDTASDLRYFLSRVKNDLSRRITTIISRFCHAFFSFSNLYLSLGYSQLSRSRAP